MPVEELFPELAAEEIDPQMALALEDGDAEPEAELAKAG